MGAEVSNIYFDEEQTGHNQTQSVGARLKFNQVQLVATSGNFSQSASGTSVDTLSVLGIKNTQDGAPPNKTDGKLEIRMSPTSLETDYYTEVVKTGVIVFSNSNRLYMSEVDDQIVLESFVHNNITTVTSVGRSGNLTGTFTVEIAVRRPGGTYTDYVEFTSSAIALSLIHI